MKKGLLLLSMMLIGIGVRSQQLSLSSLLEIDPYMYNPATAGFKKSLAISGLYRNQWNGIAGGASSQMLSGHLPLYILNGAAGAKLIHDQAGATERIAFELSYNYVIPSSVGLFSIGGAVGWTQINLNGNILRTPNGDYSTGVDHRDDHLPIESNGGGTPHLGIGAFWTKGDISAGLAYSNWGLSTITLGMDQYKYEMNTQLAFHANYKIQLPSEYELEPYILIVSNNIDLQTQFGVNMQLPNNMMVGAAFRGYAKTSADAFIMKAGLRLNEHFRLFYAFDYLISELSQVSSNNTHEFALAYNLNKPIRTGLPPRIIYNPRF